ncbi:MAG: tetratricopeptide repeat protein [Sandaracinaceae bacterium]|nr:tetratricopeptide repeat protein [Sandaracinaceae bacterium]
MNDDDLLAKATRELREAGDPPLPELRQTRRRIMEASSRAEKPSRRWVWLVGQLAAFLLAATALAATTGQLQPMIEAVRVLVGAPSAAPEPAPVQPRPRGARRPAASAAPAALPPSAEADAVLPSEAAAEMPEGAGSALAARSVADDVAPALPRAAVTDPTRAAAAAPGHHVVAQSPATSDSYRAGAGHATDASPEQPAATAPVSDPDLALYREAHRAHFVQRDSRAALAAWDRYLAAHPRGSFALEARYNRALCLVRLGRHDAARQALAPFAAGDVGGGYRRTEASALLEALDGR